ncbi:MAG: alanine racemase [Devosia nanyangense]|uniref:Alanine racemase n=1 Tax=Devosia nanyangense TaxID=1228055 RepID=A0A933NZM6_9HYPH|nr:alanine racemase [Devosia nanyangense]
MALRDLETPTLVLDRQTLEQNTARMTRRFAGTGVRLRPHMKTSKSIQVARLALAGNFGGITVSTLKEAEYFAEHGITDITYAVSIMPDKLGRVIALKRRGVRISIITDQVAIAEQVSSIAASEGVVLDTFIELDSGERRAGVLADSDELGVLGLALEELPGTQLEGVLTHAGHSYQGRSLSQIQAIAESERLCATTAADRLRSIGLVVPVVSVGSTPTATHGLSYEGVNEVRCGVYMFGDVFQSEINSCRPEDIALSVLATVIGHRRDLDTALIDAGALALSKDRSTGAAGLPEDVGYGLVLDATGTRRIDGVQVGHVYQEHGMLVSETPFPFEMLPVGSRVRILPNHACMTAAMHPGYHVVDGADDTAMRDWPRINGW